MDPCYHIKQLYKIIESTYSMEDLFVKYSDLINETHFRA